MTKIYLSSCFLLGILPRRPATHSPSHPLNPLKPSRAYDTEKKETGKANGKPNLFKGSGNKKMRKKKTKYTVRCVKNPEHIFDKVYDIEEGSEDSKTNEVLAYCPYCDAEVGIEIQGKVPPDVDMLRRFEHLSNSR